jgi:YfiR/HmsC-like
VSYWSPRCASLSLAAAILVTAVRPSSVRAGEEVTVPARVQAQLLAAVASFQTNMNLSSPDGAVQILVLTRDNDADSDRFARQLTAALGDMKKIMRRLHRESVEPYRGAASLAAACRERRISIVYLAPGLGDAIPEVAQALRGSAVLTAGAVAGFVARGVVLGFDLVSGRAEMLLNPTQMRALDVKFPPSLFQLMRIVE